MLSSSVSTFERDPRRQQELRLRPLANAIYQKVFTLGVGIARYEKPNDFLLDKHFAVDVQLTLASGQVLTAQEKFLSYEFASFNSVTVEYEQDQFTHEHGDWFKIASQLYFCGYASQNERTFSPWVLLNWPAVVLATEKHQILWRTNANQNGRAKASFRYTNMYAIPGNCIVACSWEQGKQLGLLSQ